MSYKLKILVISQYFWPENFRINELVGELVGCGHEVVVLTGKPNYPTGSIFPEYRKEPMEYQAYRGATIVRASTIPRGKKKLMLFLNYLFFPVSASIKYFSSLRKETFDVIFVFEPSPITVGIPALVVKKYSNTPIVFWVLDIWPDMLVALGIVKSKIILGWVGKLVSTIYSGCDIILGSSKSFEVGINRYSKDKSKFRYFPNWTESVFSNIDNNYVKPAEEVEKSRGDFNVVFTGNLGESQDLLNVLNAAETIPESCNVNWFLVGDGRMKETLQKEIKARELETRVFLLGSFPIERMPAFYYSASALLVSLRDDPVYSMTVPGKIPSYLSAGKPILAMLNGEGANVISEAYAGLCCSAGDYRTLAKNVLIMREMEGSELLAMGQSGKNYAAKEFNKDILVSQLQEYFRQVKL